MATLATLARRVAGGVGVVPPLLGATAVCAALIVQYGAALHTVRLSLSEVILLIALVSGCWLLGVKHMSRKALTEGRKFETLLNAAPEAIIGVSDDGAIRFANSRVSELFGYSAAACGEEIAHGPPPLGYVERPGRHRLPLPAIGVDPHDRDRP